MTDNPVPRWSLDAADVTWSATGAEPWSVVVGYRTVRDWRWLWLRKRVELYVLKGFEA